MAITVVGKKDAQKYSIICTDATCRNVIEFDQNDVKWNKTYSMGRECGMFEGICCPDCNEVLRLQNATKI